MDPITVLFFVGLAVCAAGAAIFWAFGHDDSGFVVGVVTVVVGFILVIVFGSGYAIRGVDRGACVSYDATQETVWEFREFTAWTWGCYTDVDGVLVEYENYFGVVDAND